jgi:hypothetical protein
VLEASIPEFSLRLGYVGPQDKPFYAIALHVPPDEKREGEFVLKAPITKAQAGALIDHLDRSGFLARASESEPRSTQGYLLEVSAGKVKLREDLGWGPKMLARLDALAGVLEGEPARAMATLLGRLIGLRAEWQKAAKDEGQTSK